MVAEPFKLLEALFPGRIDLGLGRAPGTDQVTVLRAAAAAGGGGDDDFLERLQELMLLETRAFPEGHPFRKIEVMPSACSPAAIFLLGSSDYSAHLSAHLGMGFAFAHHFASHDAVDSMISYRRGFQPVPVGEGPARDPGDGHHLRRDGRRGRAAGIGSRPNVVKRTRGEFGPIPSPEEAAGLSLDGIRARARAAQPVAAVRRFATRSGRSCTRSSMRRSRTS